MDKRTGKKRRWNIGTAQPAYDRLKNSNRSDVKQEDERQQDGKDTTAMSRLKRKRLLHN